MKRPRFINSDKTIFIVHIADWYWKHVYPHWEALTEYEKKEKRNAVYDEIDQSLQSKKKQITIYSPMQENEKAISVQQTTGRKRAKIVYSLTK